MDNKLISKSVSVSNLIGCGQAGFWLRIKKCLYEIVHYRPWRARGRRLKTGADKAQYPLAMSVIVCTYNRTEKLKTAVVSLINQTLDLPYEIIIVNNGGEINEKEYTGISGADVRVVTEKRRGLSCARNTGGRAAKGKFLVYADDDIRADKHLLERIYSAFLGHRNLGIVGGQIVLETQEPRPEIILEGHETLWSEYTVGYKKFREVSRQYEFPFGANFSVEHGLFDAVGGFDERYGRVGDNYAGGEETAMCFKALHAGYKIGIEPSAVVYHCVDENRFTKEHVRHTIRAGIFTTQKLYEDGYSPSIWDEKYIRKRAEIARAELEKLKKSGETEKRIFYKECEKDAFEELGEKLRKEG